MIYYLQTSLDSTNEQMKRDFARYEESMAKEFKKRSDDATTKSNKNETEIFLKP